MRIRQSQVTGRIDHKPTRGQRRLQRESDGSSIIVAVLHSPLVIIFWWIFCISASVLLVRSGIAALSRLEVRTQAEAALKEEEARGLELMQKLEEAKTDFAKERIIRDELGLQKPGEEVLQIRK